MSEKIVMPAENEAWREAFDYAQQRAQETGYRYEVATAPVRFTANGRRMRTWQYFAARKFPIENITANKWYDKKGAWTR